MNQPSFVVPLRSSRRVASADFSPSVVACTGRALRRPPLFFGVSGSVAAPQSGKGVVTKDAQPCGRPRSLRSLDAAR
jgi:hypothetical protein